MFIDPRIGTRPEDIIATWEWARKGASEERSIHAEKAPSEGYFSTQHTLLGFGINTETGIIEVPPAKVMGARVVILSDVYKPGCGKMELQDVQVLRGLCQRWATASLYWEMAMQALGALLRFADECDGYISRPGRMYG